MGKLKFERATLSFVIMIVLSLQLVGHHHTTCRRSRFALVVRYAHCISPPLGSLAPTPQPKPSSRRTLTIVAHAQRRLGALLEHVVHSVRSGESVGNVCVHAAHASAFLGASPPPTLVATVVFFKSRSGCKQRCSTSSGVKPSKSSAYVSSTGEGCFNSQIFHDA